MGKGSAPYQLRNTNKLVEGPKYLYQASRRLNTSGCGHRQAMGCRSAMKAVPREFMRANS